MTSRYAALAAVLCATVAAVTAQQPTNVWDGAYTAGQAARGQQVFNEKDCVTCHAEDGRPGDDGIPPIVGPYFMSRWDGQSVGDITAFIAENMPRTKPRTLTPQEAADVTAYLFRLNELPAGTTPLSVDAAAARGIRFTETAPAR